MGICILTFIPFEIESSTESQRPLCTVLLQKRCKSYKYRNRDLYPFRELLEIPELAADLKVNESDE